MRPIFAAMVKNIVYEVLLARDKQGNESDFHCGDARRRLWCCLCACCRFNPEKVFSSISSGAAANFQMSNMIRKAPWRLCSGFMIKHFVKDMNIGAGTSQNTSTSPASSRSA